jgi:hypothetical protein
MYVQRNNEARSCNQCCSGKAKSITYFECVFAASGIQQEMRMRYIGIYGLSDSTVFSNAVSQMPRLSGQGGGGGEVIEHVF